MIKSKKLYKEDNYIIYMVKNYESRNYSITDFYKWHKENALVLNPNYQRRRVWSEKAKSYLMDTIIRGLPISKIYMRETIDIATKKQMRDVVDGQQRLSTIFLFIDDGFSIKKEHNKNYAEMFFSQLPDNIKQNILGYTLSVDVITRIEEAIVLDIFARLNTYTISLNPQELRNAKYFGFFKQTAYSLALKYNVFWLDNKIFSKSQIARMQEVEFVSDLIILILDGVQTRTSKLLDEYYKKFDNKEFDNKTVKDFEECITIISELYKDSLKTSFFNNKPSFYILFGVIYDLKSSQNNLIKNNNLPKLKNILDSIENLIENKENYEKYNSFIDAFKIHTTNKKERSYAINFIKKYIKQRN